MTTYLVIGPGGLDMVAAIATSTRVDMSFIIVLQMLWLFIVLLTGPAMTRVIPRYAPRRQKSLHKAGAEYMDCPRA